MSQILYVSKYALTPTNPISTRQFYFSKYFCQMGKSVTLISSQSSGHPIDISKYNDHGSYFETDFEGVNHHLIKGCLISLGFNIQRVLSWIVFEIKLWKHLQKFKSNPPEVLIVSSLSLLSFINGVYFKRKTSCKLVLEVRDIWPLTLIEIGKYSSWNPVVIILGYIEKFGYNNADLIVGTMPRLDLHVNNIIKKPFNFAYVPMGYDPDFYKDIGSELPPEYTDTLPLGKFIVTYAGAIGKVNLVEEIVEAAKILNEPNNDIFFLIIGNGPLKNKVEKMANGLRNILFIPKIEKRFVNSFLSHSSLLLHPVNNENIYRYGISPNKWIDYMFSKRPVLVPYGGYPTIINQACCGKFIEPNNPQILADEILNFSRLDKQQLIEMGLNGFNYLISELSYEDLSIKFLDYIYKLEQSN